jgi:hypothetical protein
MSDYETFGGSRNSGYIKLLLSKYHHKRGAKDFNGPPVDKYREGRKMDTGFYQRKMEDATNNISDWINDRYGKIQRKDVGQQRLKIGPKTLQQQLNKPFTAQERAALTPEQLAIVRAGEAQRARESRARRKAKKGNGVGYGVMPNEKTFYDLAVESYKNPAVENLSGFTKFFESAEVKAYINESEKTILIASRGTKTSSKDDLNADASIAVNGLSSSSRYQRDREAVANILQQYPSPPYDYYLTGHSLGGAVVSQLKKDFPQLKNAVVYNSANQPKDLINQQADIKKMYIDDDPLYNLGGQVISNKVVIPYRKTKTGTYLDWGRNLLANTNPLTAIANRAYQANIGLDAHNLSNFSSYYGGRKKRNNKYNGGFVHYKGMPEFMVQKY